jgi:hypothetical protein
MVLLSFKNLRFSAMSINIEIYLDSRKWNMVITWNCILIKKQKVTEKYMDKGCSWQIYDSLIPSSNTFMVKSLKEKHSCIRLATIKAVNLT